MRATSKLSNEERRRIEQRAYEQAWETWFSALPAAEQAQLRQAGIAAPIVEKRQHGAQSADEEHEAPEIAEPEVVVMSESEYAEVEQAFARALIWSVQAKSLVEMGQRLTAMLKVMRPTLLPALTYEIKQEMLAKVCSEVGRENVGRVGELFGAALEWMRRGPSFSAVGQRTLAMAYVMGIGLAGELTLEQIGEANRKTRQGVDKLALDARDTFAGIRSRAMRGEDHRIKCRNAQLRRA